MFGTQEWSRTLCRPPRRRRRPGTGTCIAEMPKVPSCIDGPSRGRFHRAYQLLQIRTETEKRKDGVLMHRASVLGHSQAAATPTRTRTRRQRNPDRSSLPCKRYIFHQTTLYLSSAAARTTRPAPRRTRSRSSNLFGSIPGDLLRGSSRHLSMPHRRNLIKK